MTTGFTFVGAVFDVDDTLLDNQPSIFGLHERSRLAAVHEVGARHGISKLSNITQQENADAFLMARVHTMDAAVWNILRLAGLVTDEEIDLSNEFLQEIVQRKNELHAAVLREHGREVTGAREFVQGLALGGLRDRLAVASSSIRRDIDIFLDLAKLAEFFPAHRIISRESIEHPKPHKQPFDLAFKSLGLPDAQRRSVLAFEDDPHGVRSAHAAGLFTCAITTRYDRETFTASEIVPDLIADSYPEFAQQLSPHFPDAPWANPR